MKVVVGCLDGENLVGSRVFKTYSYLLEAHDKTAETAAVLCLIVSAGCLL